jgi:hypothetical protein
MGVGVGVGGHMKQHDPRLNDLAVPIVLLSDTQAQS